MTDESMIRRWLTAGLVVAGLSLGAFAGSGAALADEGAADTPSVSAATDGQDPPSSETRSTLPPGIRISQRTLADLTREHPEQLRLQMMMDRRSKLFSTLSNVLRKASDTAQTITGNIK